MLLVGLIIASVFSFFFIRISDVISEADNIFANLQSAADTVMNTAGKWIGMTPRETDKVITQSLDDALAAPINLVTSGLSTSGYLLANFAITFIYIFFFLLYRTAFKRFVMGQMKTSRQIEGEQTIREIQRVASDYLGGMGIVMLVLGVLNSLGLYLIGIQYPLVWGFLAALLAVIPYVGTTLGGLLPLLYAIATTTTLWQPLAVVALYSSVQFLEGNLITPKIVGNSVKINALAAIVSLILGAAFWGLAGLILAIPLLAMVRIVFEHIKPLMPLALLLSDDLYAESGKFEEEYSAPEYRLASLFLGKNTSILSGNRKSALAGQPPNGVRKADTKIIAKAKPKQGNRNAGR